MDLLEELKARVKEFRTDGYPMSIGEIVNLYENDEMVINPNFQRFFRWTQGQKSRLVESFLLGIPTPAIFVYQRSDGVWELVDGLQRISTILEFVGKLKGTQGAVLPPLKLIGTKLLPSLDGIAWEESSQNTKPLPKSLQLDFKRSKSRLKLSRRSQMRTLNLRCFSG
ncbi:uncharacterized protein DUF262 [Nitrosospira sp. Nsp2]|uniref:DUF262 domain-containing protein n=1 Tax=Nitrosospira sp. Nsp2 TaxID=136548 RepID=UPI000D45DA09|nr:DUF262 domain-containing protein [Nitrosospira sp. Nsp2]PTR16458.1 uncharacterized protein DUF262 [Nitrosospira sp. Nsp2]